MTELSLFQESKTTWGDWCEWASAGLTPKIRANRFDNNNGDRFYWWTQDNEIVIAAGITTWMKAVIPESTFLIAWKVKYGKDYPEVLNLTADYGTAMHSCFAYLLKTGEYPPQEMRDNARQYTIRLKRWEPGIPVNQIEKDIAAFIQWTRDYKVEPMLIEVITPCQTPTGDWYCMTQDLPCKITYTKSEKREYQDGFLKTGPNKGKPKMVTETLTSAVTEKVCVDFKSNPFAKDEKSFYDTHKYQLMGAQRAMFQNFDIEVTGLYNWSPKAWKTEPGYQFKRWEITDLDIELFHLYEKQASLKGAFRPKGTISVFNEAWSKENSDAQLVTHYSYEQYVREVLMNTK